VIEVVVGGNNLLDVLDAQAFPPQTVLERRERLVAARAGVDERDWVPAKQPDVDRLDVR
jgi:hypothetical protein